MPSRFAEDGRRLLEEEQWPAAVQAFSAGLAVDPADPDCLLGLARARLQQGERADAEEALRRLSEEFPGHPEAASHLAWLASTLGEEDAMARLEALAARPGAGFEETMNLGMALFDRGHFAGAEAVFEVARALAPHNLQACLEVGRLRLLRGDAERAWPLFTEAARGGDPLAQGLLIRAQRERGHLEEAWEAALAAKRATPTLSVFTEECVELARLMGNAQEAVKQAETLRLLDPRSPRHAYRLGVVLCEAGQPADAVRALREALRLAEGGDPGLRDNARALLRSLGVEDV